MTDTTHEPAGASPAGRPDSSDDAHAASASTAAQPGEPALIEVRDLVKTFHTLDAEVKAADGITLDIPARSITALIGPSGSGKSTLLHMIGALDRPDSGSIRVRGDDITTMKDKPLAAYRRSIGYVFQHFNLLATLSVIDNVIVPVLPYKTDFDPRERAKELLAAVGLEGRENTLATRLSGGQQQRVAIARSLINKPTLLLADEPTGNLDTQTGLDIIDLLFDLRETHDTTLVIATHDNELAARCDNIVRVRDGQLADHGPVA